MSVDSAPAGSPEHFGARRFGRHRHGPSPALRGQLTEATIDTHRIAFYIHLTHCTEWSGSHNVVRRRNPRRRNVHVEALALPHVADDPRRRAASTLCNRVQEWHSVGAGTSVSV